MAEIAQLPTSVLSDAKKYLKEIEAEQRKGDKLNDTEMKVSEMLERIKNGEDFDVNMIQNL